MRHRTSETTVSDQLLQGTGIAPESWRRSGGLTRAPSSPLCSCLGWEKLGFLGFDPHRRLFRGSTQAKRAKNRPDQIDARRAAFTNHMNMCVGVSYIVTTGLHVHWGGFSFRGQCIYRSICHLKMHLKAFGVLSIKRRLATLPYHTRAS